MVGEQVNVSRLRHSKLCASDRGRLCCFNSWRLDLVIAVAVSSSSFKRATGVDILPVKQ